VHPESILVGATPQDIRIINRFSWPGEPVGIQQVIEQSKGSYISPKELQELDKRKIFSGEQNDEGYNDAYSIGMTVLEMGTLLSSEDLYDFFNFKLDEGRIQERLALFGNLHPDGFLKRTVANLLSPNLSIRPSCG
jgi:hypothetical protein